MLHKSRQHAGVYSSAKIEMISRSLFPVRSTTECDSCTVFSKEQLQGGVMKTFVGRQLH